MGQYLQVPENHNKAQQLIDLHGAELIDTLPALEDVPDDKLLVCAIDSGPFEAVGVIYDQQEWLEFSGELYKNDPQPDNRPRKWLLIGKDEAVRMNPALERYVASQA